MSKPGRNDPCPCGSGKKYKKCCLKNVVSITSLDWQKMRRTEGNLVPVLINHAQKYYSSEALFDAWAEFKSWKEELPDLDDEPEPDFEALFMPWFLFNWIPDNDELPEELHSPEIQIAMHYLNKMGQRINSFERHFIEEMCSQPFSFFLITDVNPGKSLTLKDLLLQHEVTVHERTASTLLPKGYILFARIITMDNNSIMVGCGTNPIPPGYIHYFIDLRESFTESGDYLNKEILLEDDFEIREIYLDISEELANPTPPQLRNSDGDELEPTKLYYLLNCSAEETLEKLATLSFGSVDEIIHHGEFNNQGKLQSITFLWLNQKASRNTVLGDISIDGNQLIIGVNSRERAESIKRKITHRLGKRAVFQRAVIESIEKMLEEAQNNPSVNPPKPDPNMEELMATPEIQTQMKEMAEQHWKEWLDTPLPALNDQTPREASKSSNGKERVEALFLQFADYDAQGPQPFSPDIEQLRRSLGMD